MRALVIKVAEVVDLALAAAAAVLAALVVGWEEQVVLLMALERLVLMGAITAQEAALAEETARPPTADLAEPLMVAVAVVVALCMSFIKEKK